MMANSVGERGGRMTIGASEAIETTPQHGVRGFLGWRIVGVGFIANFIAGAITLSTFGNFVDPVSTAFGVQRSTVGLGMSITFLVMGLLGPFAGVLLDRGWARSMMATGSLVAGTGLILLSQATTLSQAAVLFCGVVGTGAALFGIMPSMALTSNWFMKRRGLAIGIAVAGATIASYAAPAAAQYLIDVHGWRTAVMAFGAATILIGFPTFAGLVVGRPEEVGQIPDGELLPEDPEPGSSMEAPLLETGELVRDPRLWLLAFGFGLVLTSPVVLTPMVVPYGLDLGFTGQEANVFFLAMIPFSLLGKVVIGGLADVAPIKPAIALVVLANMLVWFLFYIEPGYVLFVVSGVVYGVGIGGAMPLQGVALGRCFGRANFGRAAGLGGLLTIPVIASASAVSQLLHGVTGSFHMSFLVQIGLLFLGGGLLTIVRIPESEGATA
jgi:MFS family permease